MALLMRDRLRSTVCSGTLPRLARYSTAIDIPLYSERVASPGAQAGPTSDTLTMCVVHGLLGTGRNLTTFTRHLVTQAEESTGRPWQAVLLDQRCHGRSAAIHSRPPHSITSSAMDISRLLRTGLSYAKRADVLVGHSLGGKVCLELTKYIAESGRRPPAQTWVLDALPFLVDGGQHTSGMAETLAIMDLVGQLPQPMASRDELYALLKQRGLSQAIQLWLGSNLKPGVKGGVKGLYWMFNIDGARDMIADYYYTALLQHPPPDTSIHIIRAQNSDRWTQQGIRRLQKFGETLSSATPDHGSFYYHELPNAGHWVHVDNPAGVIELMLPFLSQVK